MGELTDKARRELSRKLGREEALRRCAALAAVTLVAVAALSMALRAALPALAGALTGGA